MKKSYWYLIGGVAVLLLSIPVYRLYHASDDMVDTLDPGETEADQPETTQLPVMTSPTPTLKNDTLLL